MRLIIREGPGKVGFNFMWVPTFIGQDPLLKKELEKELAPHLVGQPLNDATLDKAHELALDFICSKWHKAIPGLRDYLDAMKFVEEA